MAIGAELERLFGGWSRWAVVAGATVFAVVVVLGFLSSLWLGLGLIVVAALGVAGYWVWTELPKRHDEGSDRAETAEQERRAESEDQ